MAGEIKARVQVHGKNTTQDLARSITNVLWSYDSVKRVVKNNYVILNAIVRNAIKSLNINADNFDFEAFSDNFDIHELDLESQDTLADSLAKVLNKFIVNKVDNNVEKAMDMAPVMIESRLREILNYLKSNPNDNETVDYAKDLINQLRGLDRALAAKYSRELESIVNPKPAEPEHAIGIENILKPVNEPKAKVKVISAQERESKAMSIERLLREYLIYIRAPHVGKYDSTPIFVEKAKELIERLRELNPQLASKYERELNTVLYEKEKYANYGKERKRERKVRIRYASAKITEYFNANETESESDKRERSEWKRYVKGILKWITIIALV